MFVTHKVGSMQAAGVTTRQAPIVLSSFQGGMAWRLWQQCK